MNYSHIGKALVFAGLLLMLVLSCIFIFNTTRLTCSSIDSAIWGQYGDVIGGVVGTIVALVSVFLLFETLKQQSKKLRQQGKALKVQREAFIKQQVETRFFELVRLHKDNVNDLKSKGKVGKDFIHSSKR
jgi:hypothetical protein